VLALPMAIAYVRESHDHASSYAMGSAIGTGALVVVAAAFARRVLFRTTGRLVATPIAVGLMALVGIGASFVIRGVERNDAVSQFNKAAASCQASDSQPFDSAPQGTQLATLSSTEWSAVRTQFAAALPSGVDVDRYYIRKVVANGGTVAVAIAYPGLQGDQDVQDFESGFVSSVTGVGGSVESTTMAGEPVTVGTSTLGTMAAGANGCWGVALAGRDRNAVLTLGQSILAG
jgi:hypothetical protein